MEKGYYHGVHVVLHYYKEHVVDRKEEQADMDLYPDEEDMEYVKLDNERQSHWRIDFKDNYGGVDDQKVIIHAKRWDVYVNEK